MATHATTWFGVLSQASAALSAGYAVVKNGSEYLIATTANRASYGRAVGVAITAASSTNRSFEYQVAGVLSAAMSNIGTGAINDYVIVAADGSLTRTASPGGSDDVIGRCPSTTGDVSVQPLMSLGGGAGTPGGADTQVQFNDGGAFGGDAGLTYNKTTNALTVGGALAAASLALTAALTVPNGGTGVTSLTASEVVIGQGAAALTTASNVKAGANFLSIGATVPATGAIRLADESIIKWVSGGVDRRGIYFTGTTINVGGDSGATGVVLDATSDLTLAIGGTTKFRVNANGMQIGAVGGMDLGGGNGVIGIDNATTAPSTNPTAGIVLYVDPADNLLKYRQAAGTTVTLSGGGGSSSFADNVFEITDNADATKKLAFQVSGVTTGTTRTLTVPDASGTLPLLGLAQTFSALQTMTTGIALGAGTHATQGLLRTQYVNGANTNYWWGKDSGGTDAPVIGQDGNAIHVGTTGSFGGGAQYSTVNIYGSLTVALGVGSTTYLYCTGSEIQHWQAVSGGEALSQPFRFARIAVTITGNTTLTAAQYSRVFIDLNGAPGAAFDVICPDTAGATFNFVNNTSQTATIKKSGGSGVTCAAGDTKWVHHDGTDYEARS
jgi:hypothetical protein